MRPSDRHDCQRKPVYLNDQRRKTICSIVMRHQSFSALRIAAAVGISLSPGFSHRQARRLTAQHIPPQGGMSRAHEKSPTRAEDLNLLTNLHQKIILERRPACCSDEPFYYRINTPASMLLRHLHHLSKRENPPGLCGSRYAKARRTVPALYKARH